MLSTRKVSPCHCKSKIPTHLKLTTQMPSLNIFELRLRFQKPVEYHWRYRIFAGRVYRLKVAKFQMLPRRQSFHLAIAKSKIPAHLKLSTQMAIVNIFAPRERFRKLVEHLWGYRIFAGRVYWLKVGKFQMLSRRKVFTLPLQKVKFPRTWNFPPKWHRQHLRDEGRFRKLVEYLSR